MSALRSLHLLRPALPFRPTIRALSTTARHNLEAPKPLIDSDNGFAFIRGNPSSPKPRKTGVTEIRGPYYSMMGRRYLEDVLETAGAHVDGLKFAGGSFSLIPEQHLRELIDLAHQYDVYVSTGGWIEHLLTHPNNVDVIDKYLHKTKDLGFDVVEVSTGFVSIPGDDWVRLVERVQQAGLKAKPELGIQFGAGGDTEAGGFAVNSQSAPEKIISLGKRFLDMGVERMMIESEGITENVPPNEWRTDVIQKLWEELGGPGGQNLMFEASEPKVFGWYVRTFGRDVNLFVDHSQTLQLAALRYGIWGTSDVWGKIVGYRPDLENN